jgi:hypothetical protein
MGDNNRFPTPPSSATLIGMTRNPSDLAIMLAQKSALFWRKNIVLDSVNFASKLGKDGAAHGGC